MDVNKYQTPVTEEFLGQYPEEIVEQFKEFVTTVPFIRNLISPNRRYAKDCPRDNEGKIIVDLENPHILENVDYFRQPALHYMKHGCYTFLKPNANPFSEYQKFWKEEIRRCWYGYVRKEDGEWIPGYCYWFLNYNPMLVNVVKDKKSKRAIRIESFPELWEGVYWRSHYIDQASKAGQHAIELARRQAGKSYYLSAIMSKNLILGESEEEKRRRVTVLTAYQKEYLSDSKDGTLSKFKPAINFIFANTPFPHLMLKNSPNEMTWQMGYKDELGIERGSLNMAMAVSAKDDPGKLRGKRGWILYEEMGNFKDLLSLYDVTRKSVEDGDYTFATQYLVGTSSEKESDFASAKTLLYGTEGYNIYSIDNVFDKPKQGKPRFGFFFPGYINRQGCYNKDGVSDVTKALMEILTARYKSKYSADPQSVLRVIAEDPITPAEAIIRAKSSYFPVTALTERMQQLDLDPKAYNDVYIGNLVLRDGEVEFRPSSDEPIRKYGVPNDTRGALEIYEMPQKNKEGKVYNSRYIVGLDPVNNDQAESASLCSMFVFDLFTDRIVAEFTGRLPFADDNFEVCRLLCIFYNAKCLYESNNKGTFAYFSKMGSVHLLADTPEYLRDKQLVKYSSFGSSAHPYYQKVYTPSGIKMWEEIGIGDELFAPDGTITKVVDVPVDEELDIYELTFRDGRKVRASSDHLWKVYKGARKDKNPILVSTIDLLKDLCYYREDRNPEPKYFIKSCAGVEYQYQFIPMDPYLLGLMLGDGCMSSRFRTCGKYMEFASSIEDMKEYAEYIKLPYRTLDDRHHKIELQGWSDIIHYLKLANTNSHTKFIPDCYKYNTREVRLEVLRGLLDTDGSVIREGGTPFYTTTSKTLAEDALEVARSLGINCNMTITQNSYGAIYNVRFYTNIPLFKLKRKLERQNAKGSRNTFIAITNIEYVGKEKAKCVTVDRKDGLYLIGDYVITHNCKGVNASAAINDFANNLIRDWLCKKITVIKKDENGNEVPVETMLLYTIRSRGLLDELISYTPELNVDRIRALGMVMIYRQEKIILYQGDLSAEREEKSRADYLGNDSFFSTNYNNFERRFSREEEK